MSQCLNPAHNGRRVAERWRYVLTHVLPGAAVVILVSGCHSRHEAEARQAIAAIQQGQVKADLQRYFDARRECAPVLYSSEGVIRAPAGDTVSAALQQAGLIVRSGGVSVNGDQSFLPAPGAKHWFVQDRVGFTLCYAKRKISAVLFNPNHSPYVRYTFELGDFPAWTRQPAIAAAVPQLSAVASKVEILGSESLPVRDGRVDTSFIQDAFANPTLFEFGMNFRHGIAIARSPEAAASPTSPAR